MSNINETDNLLEYIRSNNPVVRERYDDVMEVIMGTHAMRLQRIVGNTKSPIERIMAACLWHSIIVNRSELIGWAIRLSCQEEIVFDDKKYIADFSLYTETENKEIILKILVECDGHDFHEKTKEQAQRDKERDRTFTRHGYKIFRFTGSEIVRDPFACSLEVINTILDCYRQSGGEVKDG